MSSDLAKFKLRLEEIESDLPNQPWVSFHVFSRDGRPLHLGLTDRLRKRCKKERLWRSKEMLTAIKNASYGFDESRSRSLGGRDGIYMLDRSFRPANVMMQKLFDQYLDKHGSGVEDVATSLGIVKSGLLPVRLVSHHLRLLGVLARMDDADYLVLVDCDREV